MGKEEKLVSLQLKMKKRNPKRMFRLGRHKISIKWEEYELNEKEVKELGNAGCKAWLESKAVEKED